MRPNNTQRVLQNFRKSVEKSCVRRERHQEKGHVSLAPDVGKLAIIVAFGTIDHRTLSPENQQAIFMDEGEMLQERYRRLGTYDDVEVRQAYDARTIRSVLQNRDVASMVMVGHGGAGHVMLPLGEFFGWQDVGLEIERKSGHVKLGEFVQRTCCHIPPSGLTVPLGTFAMNDQRNIFGPLGEAIPDEHPDEELFQRPMFEEQNNTVDDIMATVAACRQKKI